MNTDRKVVTDDPNEALKVMAEIYQTRFIGLKDMKDAGRSVQMKIRSVIVEELAPIMLDGRKIEGGEKGILVFDRPVGRKNELIVNKTSYRALKRAFGENAKEWIGAKVELSLGRVNGKECTLVAPVEHGHVSGDAVSSRRAPASSAGEPEASRAAAEPPADDLDYPEDQIPEDGR
jgi:hypothetical protein